jgi:hypothetical protein
MKARGLTKTVIPLVVKNGLKQNIDDTALPVDNFSKLNNAYLVKLGRFQKVAGQSKLTQDIANGGQIAAGNGITTYRDELLIYSAGKTYSYNDAIPNWVDKGFVTTVLSSSTPLVRNTQQQTVPDATINAGTAVYAWEDTSGACKAEAIDVVTGAIIANAFVLRAGSVRPKTISQAGVSLIFYAQGTTLYVRKYDRSISATSFGPEVALVSDLNAANFLYDVCPFVDAVGLTYRTNGNQIKFGYVTLTPQLGSPIIGYPNVTTLNEDATGALTCWALSDQQLMVAYYNTTNGTRITARKATNLLQVFAPVTAHAAIDSVRNITGVISSGTTSTILFEIAAGAAWFTVLKTNTVTIAGALGTETLVLNGVGLASKAFLSGTPSQVWAQVVYDTPLQATFFVTNLQGQIASRIASGVAGGLTARSVLPEVSLLAPDKFLIPSAVKSAFLSEDNTTFSRTGILAFTHDFTQSVQPASLPTDTGLYLLSAVTQVYDGVSFFEQGFHTYPENMSFVLVPGGGLSVGTYQYAFMWEWFDAAGLIHRSAPSVPVTVTVPVGPNNGTFWSIPSLTLTQRTGIRTAPVLAVYRTKEIGTNGGALFYRVSSRVTAGATNGIVLNNPAVQTLTFTDLLSDAAIAANELLYTIGGVLENLPPEPCTTGTLYKGRIVINSTDKTGVSYYTKLAQPGEAPAFNPILNIAVDPEGGDISAFGVLDDKLILDKPTNQWVTFGEPASNTGINGTLATPERISTSTGCASPNSIFRSEFGLFYRSAKGYYLLNRGLQEEDIGTTVQDFLSLVTASTVAVPTLNQIRFYHTNGQCIAYDTDFKTWSTFSGRECVGAVIWRGIATTLSANGIVKLEDNTSDFNNSGSYSSMEIETGWISVNNIQGFARVWRLLLLCQYRSPHKLMVRIATDFEPAWKQTTYVDPAVGLNTTPYGSGVYGSGQYGGELASTVENASLDSVYQARIHIEPQKCESIKINITDLQSNIPQGSGEGLRLNTLTLEVGAKVGTFKPHARKSFGG